jgi:hypothetical protein
MTDLLNQLSTIAGAGIGGIAFFATWVYMVLSWLGNEWLTDNPLSFLLP